MATDRLGDRADGHAFFANGVGDGTRGSLLNREPEEARGVFHLDRRPSAGPVADVAGDALGPGQGDELGDEAVPFPLAMHRTGQHHQAGAHAAVCYRCRVDDLAYTTVSDWYNDHHGRVPIQAAAGLDRYMKAKGCTLAEAFAALSGTGGPIILIEKEPYGS
jgi:hypothetical protein